MAFIVGDKVWFKRAGSTPFIAGNASDAGATYDAEQTGRGKAAIGFSAQGMLRAPAVPQIKAADLATPITSQEAALNTANGGSAQGVLEQGIANPLAPHTVTIPGQYTVPTDKALFNPGSSGGVVIDEGATDRNHLNTINSINPNFSAGRSASSKAAVAEGPSVAIEGPNVFASDVVDIKSTSKRIGLRVPSSQLEAGEVIAVVSSVRLGTISPDGTRITRGKMYHVNWGASDASKPHQAKQLNSIRTLLHADEDLVAA